MKYLKLYKIPLRMGDESERLDRNLAMGRRGGTIEWYSINVNRH